MAQRLCTLARQLHLSLNTDILPFGQRVEF